MSQQEASPYFSFYPHTRLVRGARGAAIHELFKSQVFWIREPQVADALAHLSVGSSLAEAQQAAGLAPGKLRGYLTALAKVGLGLFTDHPTAVEPFRPKVLRSQADENDYYRDGGRLGVELADRCVYDCPWCTSKTQHTSDVCACGVWPNQERALPVEQLVDSVEELHCIGVDKLVVHGGEPFLEPRRLWALLDLAARLGMVCEVHTTGSLIDDEALERLRGKPVHLVLMIASDRADDFDAAVGRPGSFDALLQTTQRLKAAGVPFSAKVPVSVGDVPAGRRVAAWARELGAANVFSLIHSTDCAAPEEELQAAVGLHTPQSFSTNVDGFLTNSEAHFCFDNAVFITRGGQVTPCIGWRDPLADLNEADMESVLHDDLLKPLGRTARRHTSACGGCEFRFGCRSCLVRTLQRRGATDARHWNCTFDPASGSWPTSAVREPAQAQQPVSAAEAGRAP